MAVRLRLRVDTPLLSLNLGAEQSAIRAPVTERNPQFCRSAPNRFGISHVVGFVSLDAAGSHPAKRKSGACRAPWGLARTTAFALNHQLLQQTRVDTKMLESEMPGPARRNPANPARSGRKQR